MADFSKVYREYLNTVKGDIQVQMKRQKRFASGNAYRTLRVVANQHLEAEIRGERYISTLETGVGSQPSKVGGGLINDLAAWMLDKGIHPFRRGKVQPNTVTNIKRAAGAIARSLVEKGTAIKRGQQGLDIQAAIDENMPDLVKSMGKEMVNDFTKEFKIKRK